MLLDHAADPNLRATGGGAEAELPLGLALSLPSVLAAREMARLLSRDPNPYPNPNLLRSHPPDPAPWPDP